MRTNVIGTPSNSSRPAARLDWFGGPNLPPGQDLLIPSAAYRAAFESDPMHAHIERDLYPAAVANLIWIDAVISGRF
jgi:hypothetical protein